MNEELQKALEALETKLKGASADELKGINDAIKGVQDELAKVEKFDINENAEFIALKQSFETFKSNNDTTVKDGQIVKFFKDTAEKADVNDRTYGSKTVVKAAALMATANVVPNATDGFNQLFGNYMASGIGSVPKADLLMMPLVNVITAPGTENIYYVDRINEEGDAEFIGEGTLKPLVDAEYKEFKAPIKETALRWKQTKRLLNHAPTAVTDFATHANELIEQKIDDVTLSGDSTVNALEFDGVVANASAFIVPAELALYYADANIFDVIMAAATQVRLNNFKGQLTAVLNTVWEAKMKGIKGTDGHYVIPPFVSPDGTKVGSVNVVFSTKVDDGVLTIGDLKKFNVVMSENVSYDEGYENDDFSKNLVSKKLEAFLGSYFRGTDAGAIVSDDIATIITAIAAS